MSGRVGRLWTVALALSVSLGACAGPAPDSALVIVVDTLRPDHLGVYGGQRPTSPRLDGRARRGLVFERAYTTSPWTLPSVASVLTGQLPSRHGAGRRVRGSPRASFSPVAPDLPTLAEELGRNGLRTAAIVNNPFLHARFALDRGFAVWDYAGGGRRKMRRADVVVDRAAAWLRDHHSERFFLLLHLFDPHLNYDAPAPFRDRFTGSQAPPVQRDLVLRQVRRALDRGEKIDFGLLAAAYDEEIAFVDAQLGRLFTVLDELRLDRRVLVVVTADHGEEFGEHGGFEHGHSTFEEVVRVPLVLWGPGVRPGRRGDAVTLLDIAPTIYAALDLPPPRGLPGHSLLSTAAEGRCVVAERRLYGPDEQALIRWPWKLQVRQNGTAALYDLDRDPKERTDVAAEESELVRLLLAKLAACTADRSGPATAPVELDPAAERQLRSLGYIE